MISNSDGLDSLLLQCRSAISAKYSTAVRIQVARLFDSELDLVQNAHLGSALVQWSDYAAKLKQADVSFHLIGSGCSSIIAYLLGWSEVDPIRFVTQFSRLWTTRPGNLPTVRLVAWPFEESSLNRFPVPCGIVVHSMTPIEAIPALLQRMLPEVFMPMNDGKTFEAIAAGDIEGVFQLNTKAARLLVGEIRPARVNELAVVSALGQIDQTHPKVVSLFLELWRSRRSLKHSVGTAAKSQAGQELPLVFQESIMDRLRREGELLWEDTYRFVRAAAKRQMKPGHPLWSQALEGLQRRFNEHGAQRLQGLATACQWSVCRAHHAANAITSYKAAYFRTHHRLAFEKVLDQVSVANRRSR